MKVVTMPATLILLFASQFSVANTLILPSSDEPGLIGAGGILDTEFGLANLMRIDDDFDQYWAMQSDEASVFAVAKYAGYTQNFGLLDSDNTFSSLLYAPYMDAQSSTFSAASSAPFRFALHPGSALLFSSDPQDNVSCGLNVCDFDDHMVSWLITDGQYAGDYVIAWEDLKHLGDRDYNDLVVRVSGVSPVPVPAAVWLFASGIFGLLIIARRRA